MKKTHHIIVITIIILLIYLYYYPFQTNKKCGEFYLCRLKFGVYKYDVTTEAGMGENTGYLKTNLRLYEKVGGIWEYLGCRDVKCD
jgi:hypothetical protein